VENNLRNDPIIYGSVPRRILATFIDFFILLLVYLAVLKNISILRIDIFLNLSVLLSYFYKPFFEYQFGATPGKKLMMLSIINERGGKPDLKEILLRNILHLGFGSIYVGTSLGLFILQDQPLNETIPGLLQYIQLVAYPAALVLYAANVIYIFTDLKKRSLQDRIANTFVIKRVEPELREGYLIPAADKVEKFKGIHKFKSAEDLKAIIADPRFVQEAHIAAKEILAERDAENTNQR
jgi:uncharacterized RDD family membrane protein YckC